MARIYTAQFSGVAVTAQQDLFEIVAGASNDCVLHEIFISQLTELGDAQEEMLQLWLKSGQTTTGTGGSAPAKVPHDVDDSASQATIAANNTTKASAGTIVTHYSWAWNLRVPFQIIWTPETRPILRAGRRMTLELGSTPADSVTMCGTMVWAEGSK